MRLSIGHHTEYRYDEPIAGGLVRLRVEPRQSLGQTLDSWDVEIDGGITELTYLDHFGNAVRLVSAEAGTRSLTIAARGVLTTSDTNGVSEVRAALPPPIFLRQTPLTTAGPQIGELLAGLGPMPIEDVETFHRLSNTVADIVAYEPDATMVTTTAELALERASGVCQDHAHVMIAACRGLGVPARYVSGYLFVDADEPSSNATHAWTEVMVAGLGWVGFDPSNGISPDERYVRVALGLDYFDVPPTSGLWRGQATEELEVQVTVAQQQ